MDHRATGELLYTVINSLNKEHKAELDANLIIANSWVTDPGPPPKLPEELPVSGTAPESRKKIVVAGASNMRRLIPALKLAGYEVVDLSQPSWLATVENIELLASRLIALDLSPDTVVILELFGNSTFRFRQFDDTMALPFKSGNGYHMEGEVGVCCDTTFSKLVNAVRPILDASGAGIKILVPPLPRYLYTGCCANKKHCTNLSEAEYELNQLHATMHFRPLMKELFLTMGIENFFVLDGIGSLLGVDAGNNRGTISENLLELKKYCAADGVHFTELGYANLSKVIVSAIIGMESGTLTKAKARAGEISGKSRGSVFFWRGFTSPNGHTGARVQPTADPFPNQLLHATHATPPPRHIFPVDAPTANFVRGGSRGGPIRGHYRSHRGGRRPPYWKKY
jgi:hypothetical protein